MNSERILLKRRRFVTFKTAQQTLVVLMLQKEAITTTQWSHIKTLNSFFIVFIVNINFFVLFCFCETNFNVFTIFSRLSNFKKKMYFSWKIYIPIESWNLSLTKYWIIRWKMRRKKRYFNYNTSYFPKFSLVLSANMY